ncbi:MAG: YveK family protein, partial [Clostridia bacterium]
MNDEKEIDILRLARVVLKRWPFILVAAVLGALLMLLYTEFFVTPLYSSTASVYISNKVEYNTNSESVDITDVYSSQALVPVYSSIVRTNSALEKVSKSCGLPYTAKQIASMLSTYTVTDTAVLKLTVVNPIAEHSSILANSIATTAISEITKFAPGSTAYIIDEAEIPRSPFSPSVKKNVLMGFLVGAVLVIAVVVIMEIMDTKLKD